MSDPGQIRIVDPLQFARTHPTYFLRPDEPVRDQIEAQLMAGARAAGATDVELIRCEGWSVVGSTHDWFRTRRVPLDDDTAFEQPRAFPELGVNSVQGEFVTAAFADGVLCADKDGIRIIRDKVAATDAVMAILRRRTDWQRVVAFSLTES